jgi:hypothetical protein
MARTRPPLDEFDEPPPFSRDNDGKWIGWAAYAVLALLAFCFGAWAGNFRPKVIEVVKNVPVEVKPEPKPEPKKEPEKKIEPAPEPKKEPMPTPEPKKEPEAKVEPKKEPTPEPKKKEPEPSPEPKPVVAVAFDKEILPIFKSKCMLCHGDTKSPKGGVDLRTLASIRKPADNGDALVPGNLMKSLIWATIDDGTMPPADKPQLTDAEKTKIKNWILSGGK